MARHDENTSSQENDEKIQKMFRDQTEALLDQRGREVRDQDRDQDQDLY